LGNRSAPPLRGVRRTRVKLPGVLVQAQLCIPRAHPYAVWLLPWVEGLLSGRTLEQLLETPPWPAPPDLLVSRELLHTLIDLRWAVPAWSGDEVVVDPALAEAFRAQGRLGLARALFEAEVVEGEWWADGLSGVVLSRQTAAQFDWDLRSEADHELQPAVDLQALLDANPPDVGDLGRKLGQVVDLSAARDRFFLGSPLTIGGRKDILFSLVGDDLRLLPPELAELEPVLEAHAPELFGERQVARSRVVRLAQSPVERIAWEVERMPSEAAALGPVAPVRARVARLVALVSRSADALASWLYTGHEARPVLGSTQRHFDALAEMCARLERGRAHLVLLTSAFLNAANACEPDGLADALAGAPDDTRFLVVYGHANDDLPEQQARDMQQWRASLSGRAPSLAGRVGVAAGKRRSHEKVVITSAGDWMVGSWNPASSRPHATVFECSLSGCSPALAAQLLGHVEANIEGSETRSVVERLRNMLAQGAETVPGRGAEAVGRLKRAVGSLEQALPDEDGSRSQAWSVCVRAVRAALQPFLSIAHTEIVDEQQTRDAFLAQVHSSRGEVLLASDRLADSALDAATLRDLRGEGRHRRTVRVVWGREWAGRRSSDRQARDQLRRAARTVRQARELLGPSLLTSEEPMENHAKLLVVDGLRGLVTSENLLSYGGEKGRYESRELGLVFWSPSIARHLLGRMLLQWPAALEGAAVTAPPLAWVVAGNEGWHGTAAIAGELDFEWRTAAFVEAVVRDELEQASDDDHAEARRQAWASLVSRAGPNPFGWVREEGERLGLTAASPSGAWLPYDARDDAALDALMTEAERAVQALPAPRQLTVEGIVPERPMAMDPLVARVLEGMREIPAGRFLMGDDRVREERPRHQVAISRPFLLGRTPVTQGLWEAVMGRLPHLRDVERHPDFPIIHVSYADMQRFLERLNGLACGGGFELPTEAQWEYACRAGADTIYAFGNDPGHGERPGPLERYAWTKRNARARLHAVGELEPNAFGLHDVHGLVYETMRDGPRPYTRAEAVDPVGPLDGTQIVARGGFWGRFPVDARRPEQEHFRCASRQIYEKSHRVSFRLARRLAESS
jgi:formylglycine-generating enzyme required for sulfatase activity